MQENLDINIIMNEMYKKGRKTGYLECLVDIMEIMSKKEDQISHVDINFLLQRIRND